MVAGFVTAIGLGVAAGIYFPNIWWIATLGLIPIIGGSIAIMFLLQQRPYPATLTTTIASVLFCMFMFGVGTVAVDSTRQTHALLDQVRMADGSTEIATYHCLESSWVFYGQKPIYELLRNDSPLPEGERLERNDFWQKKPIVSPQAFVQARPNAMILTTDEHVESLLGKLPDEFTVQREVDFFLDPEHKLVLVSRPNVATAATTSDSERR